MKQFLSIKFRLAFAVFLSIFAVSQSFFGQTPKDSCFKMHLVSAQFSGQLPGGDLAKRFGSNLNVGVAYLYKTRKNFLFGIDPNYFYGNNVKEDVLAGLKTSEGTITNTDGNFAEVRVNERGWNVHVCAGKIIPTVFRKKISPNPNSGIMIVFGAGYMFHFINILNEERNVPQVAGDYKKGYDRLTGGLSLKQFIGYNFLSNNRLLNFYAGFECYQGFTKSMRTYDYDLMKSDTKNRFDLLYGFRVGWILPIYKRRESENLFIY